MLYAMWQSVTFRGADTWTPWLSLGGGGQEGLGQSVFDQWYQIDKPHGCAADPGIIRILSRRKPGHQKPIKTPWQRRHQHPLKFIRIYGSFHHVQTIRIHQNLSESIKIHWNQSKSIKIHQNPLISIRISLLAMAVLQNPSESLKSIRIHQNQSECINIKQVARCAAHQNPSESNKIH